MSQKQTQTTKLSQFSLYLDKKLVSDFDKAIFPYKRSNVVHKLISEFLNKKGAGGHTPTNTSRTTKTTKSKEAYNV